MNKDLLILERTYDAPAEKIWNALTKSEELRKWYFQLDQFEPRLGFKFDFLGGEEGGEQYLHLCEITELVENEKIAYTWRYDTYPGNSTVRWELFDREDQTLLRLSHEGINSFSENGKNFQKESFNGGWTYFLDTALKNYLSSPSDEPV